MRREAVVWVRFVIIPCSRCVPFISWKASVCTYISISLCYLNSGMQTLSWVSRVNLENTPYLLFQMGLLILANAVSLTQASKDNSKEFWSFSQFELGIGKMPWTLNYAHSWASCLVLRKTVERENHYGRP